jgi:uncharacterized protein (UPF0332 family)
MSKAQSALGAAQLLLDKGFADDACNRAYYSMFDAARAALMYSSAPVETEQTRTHSGLISAFGQYVVKTGRLPAEFGKSLNRAHEVRLLADYSGDPVDLDEAIELVRRAAEFSLAVTALLNEQRPKS